MKVLTGCAGGSGAVVLAVVLMAAIPMASCASSEVAPNAPRRPPLPENCPVQLFPAARPSYASVDLASVRAVCNRALGRGACLEKLRLQTCAAGGDTAYGFKEGINPDGAGMFISATVALRGGAPAPSSSAAPAGAFSSAVCAPICSPGFACESGQCIPQCNPSCEPTEICNRHRSCEPAAAVPVPAR
ncbi:MAG TPA: hypothetical protein VLA79_00260 [Polyangia bacterium]|nr:hypothetical protein [Polyangia bacterium]